MWRVWLCGGPTVIKVVLQDALLGAFVLCYEYRTGNTAPYASDRLFYVVTRSYVATT